MTNTTLSPVGIVACFHPVGPGASFRDAQRVEITHDPSRAGVWATVADRRRLFCLATGAEMLVRRGDERWMLRSDTLRLLRPLLGLVPL